MKWHLYKKDDPNTWPKIHCPMVLCQDEKVMSFLYFWDNDENCFFNRRSVRGYNLNECYYAYIGYVPNGYKTHEVLKCVDDSNCKIGCEDNGYCMYYEFECEQQRKVNEYSIEEKRIWKEFE